MFLHVRPYKETSALLDLFTQEHGRVRAVLRGYRSKKKAVWPVLLIVWKLKLRGRVNLKTLARWNLPAIFTAGRQRLDVRALFDELSMRLLPLLIRSHLFLSTIN